MTTRVKICGLSTPQAVTASLDGGAAFLGFMFFAASPRAIQPDAAGRLAAPARGRAKLCAVTVDPDDGLLERIMAGLSPDLIQLHGRETPARAREIAARTGAGIIKVLPVETAADLAPAAAFDGLVEHLMFEGKAAPGASRPGGAGQVFDWALLAGLRFERPHILAGGLDPWNVAEAVRLSGAPLVDVSSGVERGAGIKDPALISAFLDAASRV